ncbi:MAG TPA: DUF3618 domain-containing protein [Ktedonobacterales bacterium]
MSTSSNDILSPDSRSTTNSSNESVGQLRDDIQQTRESMGATIDAIEWRLSPQRLAVQAKDALTSNAQQLAQQAGNRAQTLGADVQAQANSLALAAREQAELRGWQVRRWYNAITDQYPWFPAALLGGALVASALLLWRANARND